MTITIREITAAEISRFYLTFQQLVMAEFSEYSEDLKKYLTTNNRGINFDSLTYLLEVGAILLAAYKDNADEIIGLLIADNPYAGVSFCTWLVVSHQYQQQGVGKKLVAEWEKLSTERGAHAIRLEATNSAKTFYEKLGFTLIGVDKKGYCGIDKYLYKKKLREPLF